MSKLLQNTIFKIFLEFLKNFYYRSFNKLVKNHIEICISFFKLKKVQNILMSLWMYSFYFKRRLQSEINLND